MALVHGKQAKIYWDADDTDTNLLHGQSWSLDATHDVAEITSMQDSWRTYAGGFRDWTATVECLSPLAGNDIDLCPVGFIPIIHNLNSGFNGSSIGVYRA